MTSEVVLMNRQAVAMAADSAVTISGERYLKTYNSADKLFPLVENQPVAVMIYNNAEIMSTPWETVISLYREQSRGRPLDTVAAYADDFMEFISGNPDLFPADHQDTEFFKVVAVVYTVLAEEFDYQVQQFQQAHRGGVHDHISSIFEFVVGELHADYQRCPDDSPRGDLPCFPKGMAEQVRRRYGGEIDQLIQSLVGSLKSEYHGLSVSEETMNRLRDIAVFAVVKDAFFEHYTGVVFAGFGAKEKFPSMRSYLASSVVLGILKRKRDRQADIGADSGPVFQPFAQDRMIRTFLTGMDQYLRMFVYSETLKLSRGLVADIVGRTPNLSDAQKNAIFRDYSSNNLAVAVNEFFRSVDNYQYAVHTRPILRAINSLPKKELGETAASLIKLNSFQQKVMHSVETVGGPIDVAVITRNGGLEWKREKAEL
ncbi:hypothetical protein [Hyphococcus luteus]|uniref:Uncharacterized protein n=1 Tax=Hyphococcus luteus TaxID=2058213 RepID=A0A2S7K6M1_9PROT|nr:hypothetical protein [Marinicaulis flavus]PQA88142.1 hypothetical protein CW354_07440 [Marinicaulis flavus]